MSGTPKTAIYAFQICHIFPSWKGLWVKFKAQKQSNTHDSWRFLSIEVYSNSANRPTLGTPNNLWPIPVVLTFWWTPRPPKSPCPCGRVRAWPSSRIIETPRISLPLPWCCMLLVISGRLPKQGAWRTTPLCCGMGINTLGYGRGWRESFWWYWGSHFMWPIGDWRGSAMISLSETSAFWAQCCWSWPPCTAFQPTLDPHGCGGLWCSSFACGWSIEMWSALERRLDAANKSLRCSMLRGSSTVLSWFYVLRPGSKQFWRWGSIQLCCCVGWRVFGLIFKLLLYTYYYYCYSSWPYCCIAWLSTNPSFPVAILWTITFWKKYSSLIGHNAIGTWMYHTDTCHSECTLSLAS